jgi:hypothetical protein
MPNMQYVNRLIEQNEEEAIGAPVARAEEQFADGLVKGSAFGSKRATLWAAGKTLRAPARAPDPVASRTWRLAVNIAVGRAEIGFGLGSEDDAVCHLPNRVSLFQFIEYFIRRPSLAFVGLGKTLANAGHGI